ncbi:hypothetical protein [Clostridium perfringens]|uniref:hypothetical protein n=1 Tax=Clostridium perfringens TaxID=1502 RepID=UPI001ABB0F8C|nr:hypothetical protein [Clostridium perfringens]MBO3307918.1 hypothetical protein [Clostridium perfringens]MBO3311264.1 hypothetical protein [Clostridium perfringens]MBO3408818.1 hypothetical protein [Clostridium perfringens]
MINFIKKVKDKNLLFENFSEDELRTMEGAISVLMHIYSSELERLLKRKKESFPKLTQEDKYELENEIKSYEDDIVELKRILSKLNNILNNFKHLN